MALTSLLSNFEIHLAILAVFLVLVIIFNILYFCLWNKKVQMVFERRIKFRGSKFVYWGTVFTVNFLLIGLILWSMYSMFLPSPKVISTYPKNLGMLANYERPVTFEFNVPVTKKLLTTNILPENLGKWEFYGYPKFLPWSRKLVFYPQNSFPPAEKVMIYLSYIASALHPEAGNEHLLEFFLPPLPQVVSSKPENNQIEVPIGQTVTFNLDNADQKNVNWLITIEPKKDFELVRDYSSEISLRFTEVLDQGVEYRLKVSRNAIIYNLNSQEIVGQDEAKVVYETKFTTVREPMIGNYSPTGESVKPNEPIVIHFDSPMDKISVESHLSIEPAAQYTAGWSENNQDLTLTTTGFAKDTGYAVKIGNGAANLAGGVLENDFSYSFNTLGIVAIIQTSPVNGSMGIAINAPVKTTFNQEVDHEAAEAKFSITPKVSGYFSWNGNTMIFWPTQNYGYNTRYTFTLAGGIKSVYGLDLPANVSGSFTTVVQSLTLPVLLLYQQESYTCNVAAARMLINYRGINVTEAQLKSDLGDAGVRGSGNPYNGFVKDFGTYWTAISRVISLYRSNSVYTDWSLKSLLDEVAAGNPVMVWAQNEWSTPTDVSWTASDGTYIYAVNGMHSLVVKGFIGDTANPSQIILNDPWRGERKISTANFMQIWNYYKSAIVIY